MRVPQASLLHLLACISLAGAGLASETKFIARQSGWTVGQTVRTSSGPVSGHPALNATQVSEYLGIPYAVPPTGKLRFQPPVKFNGTAPVNGSSFGFTCVSPAALGNGTSGVNLNAEKNLGLTAVTAELLNQYLGDPNGASEDCLTVNVWTKPQVGESKKAVLLWIYGGAFVSGSSAVPWYNGQFIADQEDVVVVSFNYRISIFGFPGNPTTRANLGLLDQRLAVEWVRDNIASFGGDPSRITLFGQSAGGASVDYHSYAWASDPIVQAFIPESGTATGFGQQDNATAAGRWFNASIKVGCGGPTDDPAGVLDCMQSKPALSIAAAIAGVSLSLTGGGLPFGPVADELIVFSNYTGRKPAATPVLVGNVDDEGGLFRLLASGISDSALQVLNQRSFTCPAAQRAVVGVLNGNPTWRYRYFGVFPNSILTTAPESGAWHGSEIPVLFGTTSTDIVNNTDAEVATGKYLRGAWAAFAKDPVKGLLTYGGGWPQYSTNGSSLIRLGYNNQTGASLAPGSAYDVGCPALPVVTSPSNSSKPNPTGSGTPGGSPSATTSTIPNAAPRLWMSGAAQAALIVTLGWILLW